MKILSIRNLPKESHEKTMKQKRIHLYENSNIKNEFIGAIYESILSKCIIINSSRA